MILFEKRGPQNTEETCKIAIAKAMELDTDLVSPTVEGTSAITLCEMAKAAGFQNKIVIVSHAYGTREPGANKLSEENRRVLENYGARVVTTTHVLSGAERGLSEVFHGIYPVEIMAHTLRMFGAGVKVAVEIAVMALDAGAVSYGKKIVCLGGTSRGVDTAAVLTPAHANRILQTRIHELLCKPE